MKNRKKMLAARMILYSVAIGILVNIFGLPYARSFGVFITKGLSANVPVVALPLNTTIIPSPFNTTQGSLLLGSGTEYGIPFAWISHYTNTAAGPVDKWDFDYYSLLTDFAAWFFLSLPISYLIARRSMNRRK